MSFVLLDNHKISLNVDLIVLLLIYIDRSTSLCAGNLLHPNAMRHMSHELKTNRRTYYSELNKYHTGYVEHTAIL